MMPPPPQSLRQPPSLPDELIEEIFLRLPPDEPACLVRASLASKLWLGVLSGSRFHNSYRKHHGSPPMLGFLHTWLYGHRENDLIPHFTSTTKFGMRNPDNGWESFQYSAWDCRHGRVLVGDAEPGPMALVVWDPMTGSRRELRGPDLVENGYGAAVLCTVSGCDHWACHAGPFQVVFVALDTNNEDGNGCVAQACISLPELGDWSKLYSQFDVWGEPCSALHLAADAFIEFMPPVLVEEALHFMVEYEDDRRVDILKYDLNSNYLSLVDAPLVGSDIAGTASLMAMEDGSLGFAHVDMFVLYLWSRQMDSNRVASWGQPKIIHLRNLLPIQNLEEIPRLVGSVEGSDTIFVTIDLDIYEINVKLQRWKKLWKRDKIRSLIPYMSFWNPHG